MAPVLRTESHKEKVPRGWSYPLGVTDIQVVLEPRLNRDAYLSVSFSPKQAVWKEQRDLVDESRRYRVFDAAYYPGREHVPRLPRLPKPWDEEDDPQIITATVRAVPHDAVPRGVAVRPLLRQLLADAILKLTPDGLPKRASPRGAWLLEITLDANVRVLEAVLKTSNGGEFRVSERLERSVEVAG
ncbi:MAG: hypothetical protein ACYC8T_07415 [Myxococcaceae bacterium]